MILELCINFLPASGRQKNAPAFHKMRETGANMFLGNTAQIVKRVWREIFRQKKVENRRNTLCISRFSERISGGKDPSESADAFVRCCLNNCTFFSVFSD